MRFIVALLIRVHGKHQKFMQLLHNRPVHRIDFSFHFSSPYAVAARREHRKHRVFLKRGNTRRWCEGMHLWQTCLRSLEARRALQNKKKLFNLKQYSRARKALKTNHDVLNYRSELNFNLRVFRPRWVIILPLLIRSRLTPRLTVRRLILRNVIEWEKENLCQSRSKRVLCRP